MTGTLRGPAMKDFSRRRDVWPWAFVAVAMAVSVCGAVAMGPENNWDIRNYHIYNGYMFLHGGGARNIFPAQFQTWHNPVFHAVFVALLDRLPPVAVAIILAAFQSLNLPLIYILARQALGGDLSEDGSGSRNAALVAATLIGATGAMTISELGTSFADNVASVPLLASLAALGRGNAALRAPLAGGWGPRRWVAVAGAMAGIACGIKLTVVCALPGFALCLLMFGRDALGTLGLGVAFGLGFLAGWMPLDGWWVWHMWHMTGNPLFPQMNNLFRSPWLDVTDMSDHRFTPKTLAEALTFSLRAAIGDSPGSEVSFADARLAVALLAVPLVAWHRPAGWISRLAVFFCATYAAWLFLFGIGRFAIPLEMLSGILIVAALGVALPDATARAVFAAVVAVALIIATSVPEWGHLANWREAGRGGNWFRVEVPSSLQAPDEMFLVLDADYPSAYIIPFFGEDARFVRMQGSMHPAPGTLLFEQRRQAVASHKGPLYALSLFPPNAPQAAALAAYGLRFSGGGCAAVASSIEKFLACPLERKP